ncbi:hypothetical protein BTA51_17555 [Hahella sp. CCB-MM4]|uniref:hypothetical protein n=1 Tax=Hahella sp. (strain CCB-MM4) TaxID=1926491 RepID=UPI000B9C6FF9|nr:hypothetical protein [Hahella sp. CCB-MM4]OZG72157.1 hypothetical protein BTA51_17555 [Hahella sp. CCB-MM4]
MKSVFTAMAVSVALISAPVFADCTKIVKEVDYELLHSSVDSKTKSQARELKKQGEDLCKAGDQKGANRTLNQALHILSPS